MRTDNGSPCEHSGWDVETPCQVTGLHADDATGEVAGTHCVGPCPLDARSRGRISETNANTELGRDPASRLHWRVHTGGTAGADRFMGQAGCSGVPAPSGGSGCVHGVPRVGSRAASL